MQFSYNLSKVIIYTLFVLFFVACKDDTVKNKQQPVNLAEIEEQMLKVNTQLVAIEDESINKLIENKAWKMEETGTGLRWMIIEKGNGEKAQIGKIVSLEYKVYLLSGQLIYSSENTGLKIFELGHGGVETGLEEGILFLKLGDKARFILPSHLAYGLQGDGQLIPAKASLIYEVKLIDLK